RRSPLRDPSRAGRRPRARHTHGGGRRESRSPRRARTRLRDGRRYRTRRDHDRKYWIACGLSRPHRDAARGGSMIYRVDIAVRAPVNDTEVTDRVVDAVTNLVPNAEIERAPGEVRAEAHSLDQFSELLHKQEILDSARNEFAVGTQGEVIEFALK